MTRRASDPDRAAARRVAFAAPAREWNAAAARRAASVPPSRSPMPCDFTLGERVEARWAGRSAFFPGVIAAVNRDGTVDVDYDDGGKERALAPRLVRASKAAPAAAAARVAPDALARVLGVFEWSTRRASAAAPSPAPSPAATLAAGDACEARFYRVGRGFSEAFFAAVVVAVADDGYTVRYADSGKEARVRAAYVRAADATRAAERAARQSRDEPKWRERRRRNSMSTPPGPRRVSMPPEPRRAPPALDEALVREPPPPPPRGGVDGPAPAAASRFAALRARAPVPQPAAPAAPPATSPRPPAPAAVPPPPPPRAAPTPSAVTPPPKPVRRRSSKSTPPQMDARPPPPPPREGDARAIVIAAGCRDAAAASGGDDARASDWEATSRFDALQLVEALDETVACSPPRAAAARVALRAIGCVVANGGGDDGARLAAALGGAGACASVVAATRAVLVAEGDRARAAEAAAAAAALSGVARRPSLDAAGRFQSPLDEDEDVVAAAAAAAVAATAVADATLSPRGALLGAGFAPAAGGPGDPRAAIARDVREFGLDAIRRLAAEHEPNRDLLREAGALDLVLAALADPFAGSAMQLYAREARLLLRQ